MSGAGQNPILAAMREQHTKPFEHVILVLSVHDGMSSTAARHQG